uniref:SCP domain-containing protein n=1 Tax=Mesocestoides corti TaxID=53468 RepID=A0A5K3F1N4_MESCO
MMMMSYSMRMEELAKQWVANCKFEHPDPTKHPLYKGIGQNLALTGGYTPTLTRMAQGWYNERHNYTYANNSCTAVCGHYTQMVWATSVGPGCAKKQCDHIQPNWPKPVFLMACQYEPAGNFWNRKPYEQGDRCSKCPVGFLCTHRQCTNKTTTSPSTSTTASTPANHTEQTTSIVVIPRARGLMVFAMFLVQSYVKA